MKFNFFKKKAPTWSSLSAEQQRQVTARLSKKIVALQSGPRYKVVSGNDQWQREAGQLEVFGEDHILDFWKRGKMLNMARNQMRNSPTFNGILKQFDLNAVGTKGGKAILNFDDRDLAIRVREEFAKWTRDADFFDGISFNSMLKVILKTYITGGDCMMIFDDGLIEDSGKILLYEPDEIGDVSPEVLKRHYGEHAQQSLGRIYNANGRFIGAVVSKSQRGKDVFDEDASYFLIRDPNESPLDTLWTMPRNIFRIAQGRGVPVIASSISTTMDLEDLCGFELAAAKKNAQTIAQVLQDSSKMLDEAQMPSAFDQDTDFSSMTDAEIEEAAKAEQSIQEQTVTLDKVNAAGCVYQVLPEGFKMELLDTKHPNQNMPEFIKWLAGRSAASLGLTEYYATLGSSGGDYKAQSIMSWPAFLEAQKFLENIADWVIYRWASWASKKNIIDMSELDENWIRKVAWDWPTRDEMDEVSHQTAAEKKLRNLTGSYRDELGSDWKEKLTQIKEELKWMKENGLPHPAFNMISGGERSESFMNNDDRDSTEI